MAYTQPYGSGLQKQADEKSALYKKPKYKKFSVKLSDEGMDKLEDRGIQHYTPVKSGRFGISGDKYTKVKFKVPKEEFKANKDYDLLRGEGRYQKAVGTVGVLGSIGLGAGLVKSFQQMDKP